MTNISEIFITTFKSFKDLMIFTFSKDANIYDEKIMEKIFSDKDNKQKLLDALNANTNESIEIKLDSNNKLEIVE